MKTIFEDFLNEGAKEEEFINKLLDKGHLTSQEKEILQKLNRGAKLDDVLPKKNKIKVYTTPTCGYCVKLKDWLRTMNIEFEEIDISRNREAGSYITQKSGSRGVPQTEINGRVVVGYDPARIKSLLGI
jgi:glutaredoxin-like YruB-family protein